MSMFREDIPARAINNAFLSQLERGKYAEASVSLTSIIRKQVKEESFFADKILTEQSITADELDKSEDLDELQKIVELEPDAKATYVSFRGAPPDKWLYQKAGVIKFGLITSEKVKKTVYELRMRDNNIKEILKESQGKEILRKQDSAFIKTAEKIVLANPAEQDRPFLGGFTLNNYVEAQKMLPDMQMPNGAILMNESTSKEVLKWNASDKGYEITGKHFKKGLVEGEMMGLKIITTIKNDLVKNNEVWFFSPEDFLGKMLTLDDTTVFVKAEGWWIEFFCYKCLGVGLLNTKGIARATFLP